MKPNSSRLIRSVFFDKLLLVIIINTSITIIATTTVTIVDITIQPISFSATMLGPSIAFDATVTIGIGTTSGIITVNVSVNIVVISTNQSRYKYHLSLMINTPFLEHVLSCVFRFFDLLPIFVFVTPRFLKYVKKESQRESATYIREENTPRVHAKPKVT